MRRVQRTKRGLFEDLSRLEGRAKCLLLLADGVSWVTEGAVRFDFLGRREAWTIL